MRAKIVLCCFLWLSVLGNVAWAEKTKEAILQEGLDAQKAAKTAEESASEAKEAAESAKEKTITAKEAAESAKKTAEKQSKSSEAKKYADQAKQHAVDANSYASMARKQAKEARKQATIAADQEKVAAQAESDIASLFGDQSLERQAESAESAAELSKNAAATSADLAEAAAEEAEEAADDGEEAGEDAEDKAEEIKEVERGSGPYGTCGPTEFGCSLGNWLYWNVHDILASTGPWFLEVVFIQENLAKNTTINRFQQSFVSLAWTFLLMFLTFQLVRILSLMILQEDHSELKSLIRKVVIVAVLISSSLWICQELFTLGNDFSKHYITTELKTMPDKLEKLNNANIMDNVGLLLVLLIILVLLLVIIGLQIAIRQAEFAFLVIIGPIAIVTMINKEINLFSKWWRNLLAVILAQSLQVLMIVITLNLMVETENGLSILTTCLGFLVLTMRVPQMTNEWLGASSVSSDPVGAAKRIAGRAAGKTVKGTSRVVGGTAKAIGGGAVGAVGFVSGKARNMIFGRK